MKATTFFILVLLCFATLACTDDDNEIEIPDFNFPQTVTFEQKLSAYNIFSGNPIDLTPNDGFHLYELSSVLFTDHAHKQRLIKIPSGTQIDYDGNDSLHFPNGTIIVKTFYYYNDERDSSKGKRVIESRLLIKENGVWNAGSYLWNQSQTDATLALNGSETQVSWLNSDGYQLSTQYRVPSMNECGTCHQSKSTLIPLGPTPRNLNRNVQRHGASLNQIEYLQSENLLEAFLVSGISQIVDYKNPDVALKERGRAYLAMNCAHCHNPNGWNKASQRRFDFRYETPLSQTGIPSKQEKIHRVLSNGEMPLIGTTMLDHDGINLVTDYLKSL